MLEDSCAAVILAAGASTRLGQPKQLLLLDGETLLRRAARIALQAGFSPVVVVLGYKAARFEMELQGLRVRTVCNSGWQEGMASSLRCGIHAALATCPSVASVLVMVCDQRNLDEQILRRLRAQHGFNGTLITASSYAGIHGVPAIFSRQLFSEVCSLSGDEGARRIIARYLPLVVSVAFRRGIDDVDTPADLHHLTG